MADQKPTDLEKNSLEAHVDLCALRYKNLDDRLTNIEGKVQKIHEEVSNGNKAMIKVLVGAAGTIIAGLLSTIIVVLINF